MIVNLNKFDELVEQKYIRRADNGPPGLVLYIYSKKCAHESFWTPETRMARGLIVERATGLVIAKPFEKFFNLGQVEETCVANLSHEPYTVQEKLDGSLGIVYHYNDQWNVATKGSFNSDQAIKAEEILHKYDLRAIPTHLTLLVEIIYPANKIVVSYKEEKLVLLTGFDVISGLELASSHIGIVTRFTKMPRPIMYTHTIDEMIALQKTLPKDNEGFVIRYKNGLRVKIKGEEYLRIHKMISCMSPIAFWETMVDGKVPTTYLHQLPEEFRPEFESIVKELERQYMVIQLEIAGDVLKLPTIETDRESRKQIGLWLKDNPGKHPQAMFHWIGTKMSAVDNYIMKKIRPKANEFKEIE